MQQVCLSHPNAQSFSPTLHVLDKGKILLCKTFFFGLIFPVWAVVSDHKEMSEEGDRRRRRAANGSASGSEDDEAAQAKPGSPEAIGAASPSQNEDPVRQNTNVLLFAQSHTQIDPSYGGGGTIFLGYFPCPKFGLIHSNTKFPQKNFIY